MAPVLAEARAKLESLVAAEPTSQTFSRLLATALRIESLVRFAAGRPDADEPVARAVTLTEALVKLDRANDWVAWEFAQSQLLAGRIAVQRGDRNVALRHWERVVEALGTRATHSNDWRLLDPAAQALTLLGRAEEARPLVERLQRFGYHALDPLAASLLDAALSPPTNR
jgi:tetratricopeptide (TPR) repeat protein